MWLWVVFVICIIGAVDGAASNKERLSGQDCVSKCQGQKDAACVPLNQSNPNSEYFCKCAGGYFSLPAEEHDCNYECDKKYFSLFTYGKCYRVVNLGYCQNTCVWRMRVWATVFIIILFVSAVLIIITILPVCINSCISCVTAKKERKARKRGGGMGAGGPMGWGYGSESPPIGDYEKIGTMPAISSAGSVQPIYAVPPPTNRHNYWSHFYYQ